MVHFCRVKATATYRISMLEDSRSIQQMMRSILQGVEGLELQHIHGSTEAALEAIEEAEPDVYIVDINLPGLSGLDFITQARERLPRTQFMVYTVHDDDEKVFQALRGGANGYLLKSTAPSALIEGIREMLAGGSPMSASVARRVIEYMRPGGTASPHELQELTERENEVLQLLAHGLLYKEIAERLELSSFTVKNHIRHIYAKLQVQTRVEAVNRYFSR
jgi:DNA-binding NarL/FixJ family response regulator